MQVQPQLAMSHREQLIVQRLIKYQLKENSHHRVLVGMQGHGMIVHGTRSVIHLLLYSLVVNGHLLILEKTYLHGNKMENYIRGIHQEV